MKWGLGEISIEADSSPPRYVLWCYGDICHQPDTFIQIGSGHTVQSMTGHDKIIVLSPNVWFKKTDTPCNSIHYYIAVSVFLNQTLIWRSLSTAPNIYNMVFAK